MNKDKIMTGIVILAAGGFTYRAFRAIKKYKLDKELEEFENVMEDSENEK